VVTQVLTGLASPDPSNPAHYSAVTHMVVLNLLYDVTAFVWWTSTSLDNADGFETLDDAYQAFINDRTTTIDWEDALHFSEKIQTIGTRKEYMRQARVISQEILQLLRERMDEVKARMRVLADKLEEEGGGAVECDRTWEEV
jgi:hypothetical protein